jgi:beta-1,3-galactosyltransferase 1
MDDHYNNLTLKTLFTLKYFLNTSNYADGQGPKYLAKVDSDTYLNLPLLWKTLFEAKDRKWANITDLLMGSLFGRIRMLRPNRGSAKNRNKKYTEKWVCPPYMYNGRHYPSILSGSGYVMSRHAASCLYEEALKLPFFHLEDVLVTGFAAEACGIERRHHEGFRHLPVKLKKIKATDIMLHYRDLKGKMELFMSKVLKPPPAHLPL